MRSRTICLRPSPCRRLCWRKYLPAPPALRSKWALRRRVQLRLLDLEPVHGDGERDRRLLYAQSVLQPTAAGEPFGKAADLLLGAHEAGFTARGGRARMHRPSVMALQHCTNFAGHAAPASAQP